MIQTVAIETSCDDTSLAIVAWDGKNFINKKMLATAQLQMHKKYGGVVPEIASRNQHSDILVLLEQLDPDWSTIDIISTTTTPGLPGSLIVGKTTGRTLSAIHDIPYNAVVHTHGHLLSFLFERNIDEIKWPIAVLSVSGGHNDLVIVKKHANSSTIGFGIEIVKIATTRDDAAGEAFDKVARMLGGPYPGGKWIQDKALKGKANDDRRCPRSYLGPHDYSFSGIKGFLYNKLSNFTKHGHLTDTLIDDIAHEFQEAICDSLLRPVVDLLESNNIESVALVGGVSANTRLRARARELFSDKALYWPVAIKYCTDNAAMIGIAGIMQYYSKIQTG